METIGLIGSLRLLIPNFIGFLISFLVTALYWRAHLALAKYVRIYDNHQLWLTVWLLFFIVLLPFSTALYSNYFSNNASFIFYCANMMAIGMFTYFLLRSIIRKDHHEELTPAIASWMVKRTLLPPIIWTLSMGWVFIEPFSARFLFFLIFIIQAYIDRSYKTATSQLVK
jgi:uncharacterized membrane protein